MSIKAGDLVLVRNEKKGKLEPVYDPRPYTVTENKGTMVTASRTNAIHVLTRNTSFFKPLKVPQVKPTADKYDIEVDKMDGNILESNTFIQIISEGKMGITRINTMRKI